MAAGSTESLIVTCPGDGTPGAAMQARGKRVDDCAAGAGVEAGGIVDGCAGASVGQAGGEESRAMRDSSGKQKAMAAWTAAWRNPEAGEGTGHGRGYQGIGDGHRRSAAGEQTRAAVVGNPRQMDGAEPRLRTSVVLCFRWSTVAGNCASTRVSQSSYVAMHIRPHDDSGFVPRSLHH